MNALIWYNQTLATKPTITNAITGSCIFGFGDYLCQKMEMTYVNKEQKLSVYRILKQASFGFVVAPYLYLQYNVVVPWLFPQGKRFSTLKGVIYATTISDGIFNYMFFTYMSLINGNTLKTALYESPDKFIQAQITSLKIWPFITGFNFTYVPMYYRVVFDNFFAIFWNMYLSYIENMKFLV